MLQSFEAAATAMVDNPTLQAEARALTERIEKLKMNTYTFLILYQSYNNINFYA